MMKTPRFKGSNINLDNTTSIHHISSTTSIPIKKLTPSEFMKKCEQQLQQLNRDYKNRITVPISARNCTSFCVIKEEIDKYNIRHLGKVPVCTISGVPPKMEFISIGQSVKIKRTDGRIHSAVISKINDAGKSITVEWYERGETKGKEIDVDALMTLNPEISGLPDKPITGTTSNDNFIMPEPKLQTTQSSNNLRTIGGGTTTATINTSSNTNIGIQRGNRQTVNSSSMLTMVGMTSSNQSENIPPQGVFRSRTTNNATRMSYAASANNGINNNNNNNTNSVGATINSNNLNLGGLTNNSNNNNNTAGNTAVSGGTGGGGGGFISVRRSGVVKEVERLKENREKRRARHAELKEEKVALMNQDPGNPNWETAQMIREFQNTLDFNPLIDGQSYEDHQITVCVRKRPLSRKETTRKEVDVISVPRKDTLIVHEPRNKVDLTKFLEHHKFRFDYAFDDACDNAVVYKYTAKPLVQTIFDGGMATCFAYGQTGSGKTHTMGGEFNGKVQDCKNGIYAMAAKDVFSYLQSSRYRALNLVVSASFFEIYSGKVFDLLSDKQKLRVLEDGKQQVQVVGLTEKVVDSVEEVLKLIQHGNNARTSGQTSANANSSRSHAVFQIVLRPPGSGRIHGKFSFIDLAGNERGADTSSSNRQTRMEGAEINKSLLALKECIRALGKQSAHLPFRVSKLTQVLRDSFIGEKSKTCMIAMISPGLSCCEHTLNTLRYADRVKELVVKDAPELLRDEAPDQMAKYDLDDQDDIEDEVEPNYGTNGDRMLTHRAQHAESKLSNINNNNSNFNNNLNNGRNKKNGHATKSEFSLLRSLSEHDMSDEMLVQHEAISDLQSAEEMVVEQHRTINEFLQQFLPESTRLYNLTNFVDYDQDAYCKQGETIFTQLADLAAGCRDMMADFRAKLAKEEMLSCNAKTTNKR